MIQTGYVAHVLDHTNCASMRTCSTHQCQVLMACSTTWHSFTGNFCHPTQFKQNQHLLPLLQALRPNSAVASMPDGAKQVLHVNNFNVDYRPDGSVQQFNSDLSVWNLDGQEQQRNTIFVNKPLRYPHTFLHITTCEDCQDTAFLAHTLACLLARSLARSPLLLPGPCIVTWTL